MKKDIVLIGLPGSGKTTYGRELARRTARRFLDLDQWIEARETRSIDEIFRTGGEAEFRRVETEAIHSIASRGGQIIATGGGVVLRKENIDVLSQNAIVLFLDCGADEILARTDVSDRPLLRNDPGHLLALERERRPLYEGYADFIIEPGLRKDALDQGVRISQLEEETLRLAVIGDPISHSRSPEIHHAVLCPYYKDVDYERIRVTPGELPGFVAGVRKDGWNGLNVTMPLKQIIRGHLDVIDLEATAIGAVNTVVLDGERTVGYNTDGRGFSIALAHRGRSFTDQKVAIIGAGGAAASLAFRAVWEGAREVRLLTRSPKQGQALADHVNHITGRGIATWGEFSSEMASTFSANVVINGTPMGMQGTKQVFTSLAFLDGISKDAILCDLVYDPEETMLLREGKRRGFSVMGGRDMLLHQAIEADRKFTKLNIGAKKALQRVEGARK